VTLTRLARAHLRRSARFAVVGASGVVVNVVVLYLLAHRLAVPKVAAAALATEAATLSNFTLHDRWTYADCRPDRSLPARLLRFHASTVLGAGLALSVFTGLYFELSLDYLLADLAGIGTAAGWYYISNGRFIWARPIVGAPP
jgi:putative flippase GtrA